MAGAIHFPRTMGNQDALMWCVERDPLLRSTAAAVTLLDRPPDRFLLTEKLRRATRDLPRLRQRVMELTRALSNPAWSDDSHFDLDYHLRWVRAPRDGSRRALLDFAAAVAMQGFDRSRPLWEFIVVEDLEDGRAALVQKLHHAVTDGMGGILLMQLVYDQERVTELPEEESASSDPTGDLPGAGWLELSARGALQTLASPARLAGRGASLLRETASHPLTSLRSAASEMASMAHVLSPALEPLSPIMRDRSTSYRFATLNVSVDALKAAAHAARCKLNDAFLAALAGGWRRYHELHGAPVRELRVSLPINLRGRNDGKVAGNRMMPARFSVPLSIVNPTRRMREIRRRVGIERNQSALQYADAVAGLTGYVPAALLSSVLGRMARSIDFVAACVPGLPVPLFIGGARVESLLTFGPTAGTAANITLFSYLKEAQVAINSDPAAIPDPESLLECMREGFGEILKLA